MFNNKGKGWDGKHVREVPPLQTFGIVSGSLYKIIWHEAKARHVWVLYGADGIKRHRVRVGRCWMHNPAWLCGIFIDAKIK